MYLCIDAAKVSTPDFLQEELGKNVRMAKAASKLGMEAFHTHS